MEFVLPLHHTVCEIASLNFSRARVRAAWGKLAPVLTKRGVFLKLNGKIYDACVQRVLVYGIKTWAINAKDLNRLRKAERMMVRRMCMWSVVK